MQALRAIAPAQSSATPRPQFDVQRVRADFPILQRQVYGKPPGLPGQRGDDPEAGRVISRIARFYAEDCSNVHRGLHYLSEQATAAYEAARTTAARLSQRARRP